MRAPLSSWVIPVKIIELKKSVLDTLKFFRLFLNTLTADDKYSLISRDKWIQTIQMHLSQKQNIFSHFICEFFESALNSEHFQKKYDPHSFSISQITDQKRYAYLNV